MAQFVERLFCWQHCNGSR